MLLSRTRERSHFVTKRAVHLICTSRAADCQAKYWAGRYGYIARCGPWAFRTARRGRHPRPIRPRAARLRPVSVV